MTIIHCYNDKILAKYENVCHYLHNELLIFEGSLKFEC
jgi:hypothetical protein